MLLILLAGLALQAQQPQVGLSFEVASIKPSAPQPMGMIRIGISTDGGMARYSGVSLRDLIRSAYRVKDFQIDGPDWLGSERFDIVAKLPEGAKQDQIPEMLQSLLAERFKLTLHRDTKEHAVYALIVGKNGAKLKPAEVQSGETPLSVPLAPGGGNAGPAGAGANVAIRPGSGGIQGGLPRGGVMLAMDPSGVHLKAPAITLANVTDALSRFTERPIVDMTGIEGKYDFDLTFAPEKMPNVARAVGPMGPGGEHSPDAPVEPAASVFEAVQQYGLKLEPRKAPLEFLIIDHIEKTASEN